MRIVVPGEKERVVVCLSEDNESSETQKTAEQQQQGKEGENETEKGGDKKEEEESFVTASVGERCEVWRKGMPAALETRHPLRLQYESVIL